MSIESGDFRLCGHGTVWYNRWRFTPDDLGDLCSMAKTKQARKHRDWRRTLFLIISILIILSMALALALSFAPPPAAR